MALRTFDRTSFKMPQWRYQLLHQEMERLNELPRPVRVLEWGSGLSTILLCETLKEESTILSIEHNPNYAFDIPPQYATRLTQKVFKTQKPFGHSEAYVTYPLSDVIESGLGYDLVIIDGRNRADCLGIAALVLSPGGSVILCDAEREYYHLHFTLFQSIKAYPGQNLGFQAALLKDPVCTMRATAPLTPGKAEFIRPDRKPMPCTWAVCAVALPRESYYWIKDWIDHHIKAGAEKVVIYDNTGSSNSRRSTSPFCGGHFQQMQISKRGEEYGRLTSHLTDEQIVRELRELAATYGGKVEIVDWKPKHPTLPIIIHGQAEAYCDFIRRYRDTIGWGLFIDLDEYIYCRQGLSVHSILKRVESQYPHVSALHLYDWQFECRWGKEGPKDISEFTLHHPGNHNCGKIFVRLQDATHANVHLDWKLKEYAACLCPNGNDMAFAHYMQLPKNLKKGVSRIQPRSFLDAPEDPEVIPSFSSRTNIYDCGVPALSVDTTFVEMYVPKR